MKIVHLCLCSFFPDNYSYQENLLPKFHKKLGYDVEVIASLQTFDENGETAYMNPCEPYMNEYNIKVTRLEYAGNNNFCKKLKVYKGTYDALINAKPDILFIHGGQFWDMREVVRYIKKHNDVKVFVDNHADYSNSARTWISKNVLHKILWRYTMNLVEPFTSMFWGVLPARVEFLKELYNLPNEKCDLLVMGADDDLVEIASKPEVRRAIRKKYNIAEDDFLIVTGGKINDYRPETISLMEAVRKIDSKKVRLLIFGNVSDSLQAKFNDLLASSSYIDFVGWQDAMGTYSHMASADLIVFPGLHSVMWEQAVALGVPCIFRDIEGFHHVDVGGNAIFIKAVDNKGIGKLLNDILSNELLYKEMKKVAIQKGISMFSYYEIAKKSIN